MTIAVASEGNLSPLKMASALPITKRAFLMPLILQFACAQRTAGSLISTPATCSKDFAVESAKSPTPQ